MPELFTATHKDTGETLTRRGVPLVATRTGWAGVGAGVPQRRLVGELVPFTGEPTCPLYDGYASPLYEPKQPATEPTTEVPLRVWHGRDHAE